MRTNPRFSRGVVVVEGEERQNFESSGLCNSKFLVDFQFLYVTIWVRSGFDSYRNILFEYISVAQAFPPCKYFVNALG